MKEVICMLKEVNGVSIYLEDHYRFIQPNQLIFKILYFDERFLNSLLSLQLLRVDVQDLGPRWIYGIMDIACEEYVMNRRQYGFAVRVVHESILEFIIETIKEHPGMVLIDHFSKVPRIS